MSCTYKYALLRPGLQYSTPDPSALGFKVLAYPRVLGQLWICIGPLEWYHVVEERTAKSA